MNWFDPKRYPLRIYATKAGLVPVKMKIDNPIIALAGKLPVS
jgi:hypothetical protein